MTDVREEKPTLGVLIHSFFVIPFIIALVAVLLYLSLRLLTSEKKTPYDYLEDVRVGGQSRRWQSAFELSKLISDPKQKPQDARFVQEMLNAFEQSLHDDVRVRDYLAVAMGRAGDKVYVKPLLEAVQAPKEPSRLSVIYALGLLKDPGAAEAIAAWYSDTDAQLRLAVVTALSDIISEKSLFILNQALNDPEPNVCWEAALGLARRGDMRAKPLLTRMLTRDYWGRFPDVDRDEQNRAIIVAIRAAVLLNDGDLNRLIDQFGQSDSNMDVRKVAQGVLANVVVKE